MYKFIFPCLAAVSIAYMARKHAREMREVNDRHRKHLEDTVDRYVTMLSEVENECSELRSKTYAQARKIMELEDKIEFKDSSIDYLTKQVEKAEKSLPYGYDVDSDDE